MAEIINPLSRKYDVENRVMNRILKNIKSFCGITEENDKYPTEPAVLWPLIWQTLRILSNITCWSDTIDDLFLTQTRTQSYPVIIDHCECLCRLCDDAFVIIPLEFSPHPDDFMISVTISGMVNGEFVKRELDVETVMKGFDEGQDKLYLPKQMFYDLIKQYDNCCSCVYNMTVTMKYNAGYDGIPQGLYPAVCYILNKINNSVDIEDCHDNLTTTSGLLQRKKVGNVEYQWSTQDTTNSKTATLYSDLHDLGMIDEVLAFSRCYLSTQEEVLGDVV